jgi:type II secretory pathway pseudopilin PulG
VKNMKRGLLIAVVVALVLALVVPAALALTDNQKAELESLYQQQEQLRTQILEKQVEAGIIDAADAEFFKERMEQRWETRKERMAEGDYSFGFGQKGGCGGMGGRGFGGRGGGCGNCPVTDTELAL